MPDVAIDDSVPRRAAHTQNMRKYMHLHQFIIRNCDSILNQQQQKKGM